MVTLADVDDISVIVVGSIVVDDIAPLVVDIVSETGLVVTVKMKEHVSSCLTGRECTY